jgi:selenide, water dikinase
MRAAGTAGSDIVLVGGGHAHVHVVKAFGDRPSAGTRVTLIARDLLSPYSGMLPGVIAGHYRVDEAHIDLVALARTTAARLVHGEAVGIDRARKRVVLGNGDTVAYDLLSIDVGIEPDLASIRGAAAHATAVKPIANFLAKFERLRADCRAGAVRRIAIVGGGAGGVELILALRTRLIADAVGDGRDARALTFALATGEDILPTHNVRVRAACRRILASRGIVLHMGRTVTEIEAGRVRFGDGDEITADAALVTTRAAAPAWLATTGLACDPHGFVAVGPTLQVLNDPDVFAAGDCANLVETPREKAGVYAVRAGPPLADNLRRRAGGEAPEPWLPQRRHLSLISCGERYAVASWGPFKAEGRWVWRLKDWIDRRWMRGYQMP